MKNIRSVKEGSTRLQDVTYAQSTGLNEEG